MTCPICDQKTINCDCSDTERRQYSAIADMEELVDHLYAKIERLRLTDAERVALEAAARMADEYDDEMDGFSSGVSATLRGLLERLK